MQNLKNPEKTSLNGVLIIDGHVQGLSLARILGRSGIPVIIGDRVNCIARYSKFVREFVRTPEFLSQDFVPFLIELSKKKNLRNWAIFPTDDHVVYQLSQHKEILNKFYKIISPDYTIFQNIYNKQKLYENASQVDVEFPRTFFPVDFNFDSFNLLFPVLIKGKEGQTFYKITGKKAFQCNNIDEMREQIRSVSEMISLDNLFIQEMLPISIANRTISYTCFAIEGDVKTYWVGHKLRDHPINFGTSTMSESITVDELDQPVRRLIKKLNFTGTCEIEFLMDLRDGRYKLIEINPRTWLWVSLAKTCGVDYATIMYNFINDMENEYPQNYKRNVKWVNYLTDIPFAIKGIFLNHYKLRDVWESYENVKDTSVLDINDLLPFFVMILQLPLLPFRR